MWMPAAAVILRNALLGVMRHPFYTPWTTWKYFVSPMATRNDLWRCMTSQEHQGSHHNKQCLWLWASTALTKAILHIVWSSTMQTINNFKTAWVAFSAHAACASCHKNCFEMKEGVATVCVTNLCWSVWWCFQSSNQAHASTFFNMERGSQFHTNFSTRDMNVWKKWQFLIILKISWQEGFIQIIGSHNFSFMLNVW